jgi:hypothetical protein
MKPPPSRRRISSSCSQEVWSDKAYYEKHRTPAVVQAAFVDEFEACYAAGALFTLAVHPCGDYRSGRGLRVRALEPVLQAMRELPRLWLATCEEHADWTLAHSAEHGTLSAT